MSTITIEGSSTPSVYLGRGERRTVQLTDYVRGLIDRGFVVVVKDAAPAPPVKTLRETLDPTPQPEPEPEPSEPASESEYPTTPPPRNASREAWVQFLQAQPDIVNEVPAGASRDDLVAAWDILAARRQQPQP